MLETLATGLVLMIGLYVGIGILFALFFVWRGVKSVDPSAREGSWGFRLLIIPGSVALWPLMLRRYRSGQPPPEEHTAHRDLTGSAGRSGGAS